MNEITEDVVKLLVILLNQLKTIQHLMLAESYLSPPLVTDNSVIYEMTDSDQQGMTGKK